MKKILNIKLIGLTGVLLLMLNVISCDSDFLEVSDPNVISPDNFPTQIDDLDLMLIDLYGRLRNGYYWTNNFSRVGIGPDHTADQGFNGAGFNEWMQNNLLPTTGEVTGLWESHFENISRTNSLFEAIERFRATGITDSEESEVKLIEGQALFLRAFNYFFLVQFFGEVPLTTEADRSRLGVPLWDKVGASIQETNKERATIGEIWDFIVSDLESAEVLLAGKTWDEANRPRADIWAVKSFLGKAYAFSLQWEEARNKLQEVVEQSGKSLVPFDTYRFMFNGQNEFNDESIFEINFTADRRDTWNNNLNTSTQYGVIISPSFVDAEGVEQTNGFGNLFIHDANIRRYGFDDPAVTSEEQQDPDYIARSIDLRTNKQIDPRLTVGTLQPYVDSILIDDVWRKVGKNRGEGFVLTNNKAWCHRKFVLIDRNLWSGNVESIATNMYFLRLADVYLLYAESLQQTGNNDMALEYLNKVKRRAYGVAVDAPSAFDYPSLNATTMAAPDDHLRNDPLKYERWAELFAEGHWWFDVRRWRIGPEEAAYYENVKSGELVWSDFKYAFPLPESEINNNAGLQGQNAGY